MTQSTGALKAIVIEIQGLPKILSNGSHGHWRVAAAEKKKWKNLVFNQALAVLGHTRPHWSKAHAVFTRYSSMMPDSDNLAISFKACRDGLKFAGIIVDDNPQCLTAEYRWEKATPKKGRIVIEVTNAI